MTSPPTESQRTPTETHERRPVPMTSSETPLVAQVNASRVRTRREEVANSLSHGFGFLAALVAVPVLVTAAVSTGEVSRVLSALAFGLAIVLVFAASSLYHGLPGGRAKRFFEFVDNAAIFLLIAGTYTPFTVVLIRGTLGWTLFGLVWGLALVGVVLTMAGDLRYPAITAGLCLVMGWLGIMAIRQLSVVLPPVGQVLLWGGGLAYTIGVVFYSARRLRYHHLIWHLLVLVGASCHFLAIYWYAVGTMDLPSA